MPTIDELVVEISAKVNDKGITNFENLIKKLENVVKRLEKAIVDITKAINKLPRGGRGGGGGGATPSGGGKSFFENLLDVFNKLLPKSKFLNAAMKLLGGAVGVVGGVIAALVVGFIAFNNKLDQTLDKFSKLNRAYENFKDQTGMSSSDAYQFAAAGIINPSLSPDRVMSDLQNIAENQYKIAIGQGDIYTYQMLGLPTNSKPIELIKRLREEFKKLNDETQKVDLLKHLGLSPEWMTYLNASDEKISMLERQTSRYQLSDKDREKLRELDEQKQMLELEKQYAQVQMALVFADFIKWWRDVINGISSFSTILLRLKTEWEGLVDFFQDKNGVLFASWKKIVNFFEDISGTLYIFWETLKHWGIKTYDNLQNQGLSNISNISNGNNSYSQENNITVVTNNPTQFANDLKNSFNRLKAQFIGAI